MACCGGNRNPRPVLHHSVTPAQPPATPQPGPTLRYNGSSAVLVLGPRTGSTYTFTPDAREQAVAASDADALLRTRLFSSVSSPK